MADFKEQLLNVLGEIKGSGSFVSSRVRSFLFPGLNIKGVDEISFPITPSQVKDIIKVAHKAPFGKGSETVLDSTIRSAWEIDANAISFKNKDWAKFIEGIIAQIKPDLGIEEHSVSASLYKLLVYETGDFFVAHKDSEKEKGMFGSLVIALPCRHTGGDLLVRFDGREETIDFSGPTNEYKIPFAAFYADCEHEIKPIISGHRVCLVYNLVQNKSQEKIAINPVGSYAEKLAAILKTREEDEDRLKIVLLGHQYTPSNFTMEGLKLNDRPKAEALIQAAEIAGFHCKPGLVTSYQMGELEMDNRRPSRKKYRSYYDDDDYDDDELAENGTMGEIYDEHIEIEHWMEQGIPPLRNIEFSEKYLISAIKFNEDEPVRKEAEGYTGNAGMQMEYWYHYGAVFLWPKKYHQEMLVNLDPGNKLEWLEYYNQLWNNLGSADISLAKQLAESCLQVSDWRKPDFSPLINWLININDPKYLSNKMPDFLASHFGLITKESWVNLFEAYPSNHFEKIFTIVGLSGKTAIIGHLLDILSSLLLKNIHQNETFINHQIEQMPGYLNTANLSKNDDQAIAKNILQHALIFENLKAGDNTWLQNTTDAFTKELTREYVNDVLVAKIMEFGVNTPLAKKIMAVCKQDLSRRVNNKPQPPADWSRPVPTSASDKKIWDILSDFLPSPTLKVFDYAKPQSQRKDMENAIRHTTIDLKMETIRKGSPHTLRLTKTQDAYERDLAKWKVDEGLLGEVGGW